MRLSRFVSAFALGTAALVWPFVAEAQVRAVVSKEVSVGRASASLALEFADGGRLDIVFEDGSVLVDDDEVGTYEPSGPLEAAWRGLLGQAVALDDGPLAAALAEWTPPTALNGDAARVASQLDRTLEDAVRPQVTSANGDATAASADEQSALVRALVGSAGRLSALSEAFEGVTTRLQVHVDEDVEVAAGRVVEGDLVVVDGGARIAGRVTGNVIVIGGSIELLEGGSVEGAVRLVDATLVGNDGTVGGGVVDVSATERDLEDVLRDELRNEIREEVRRDLRNEIRNVVRDGDEGFSLLAPFRSVIRGVGGVIEQLIAVFVLALIGAGVLAFGGDKLDVIAETARRAPGRAAAVGFAGTVLLIPIWVLGLVALIVSIIGIPVAIAWLPLFPLAACAAAVVGYLAVARNTGEWLADSDYPWTHWIRKSNPLMTMVGGLLGLAVFAIASDVFSMAPFLGVISGLLFAAACIVTIAAVEIGLGAVILTRGGRRREAWAYDTNEAWEAAMKIDVDDVVEDDDAGRPKQEGSSDA